MTTAYLSSRLSWRPPDFSTHRLPRRILPPAITITAFELPILIILLLVTVTILGVILVKASYCVYKLLSSRAHVLDVEDMGTEGEETRLLDDRYGFVRGFGHRRFDGLSEGSVHREGCEGACGGLTRRGTS
ncbi:hypothetical protein GLAREA_06064 [Glarea lozoyensis ATCC 20868]|uniref:Uncharacterized protein n=1 Tax=Glarea lozoyensis (strain ATCC 20868 / MF5171) TaxID=1116229 RepID=S3D3J0_GLAL2|nr:uncharacterized protein GLAREA_06064 [Glarea lozoyensis ATCC 20868]EPE33052.1 hypothetical protein GLAREA_06064 [Glarea lozoyensis ATCC 20868]